MASAHSDAFVVQDRADVVGVNPINDEREHTSLVPGGADDLELGDGGEGFRCVSKQIVFV